MRRIFSPGSASRAPSGDLVERLAGPDAERDAAGVEVLQRHPRLRDEPGVVVVHDRRDAGGERLRRGRADRRERDPRLRARGPRATTARSGRRRRGRRTRPASAALACSSISDGRNSSVDAANQNFVSEGMRAPYPAFRRASLSARSWARERGRTSAPRANVSHCASVVEAQRPPSERPADDRAPAPRLEREPVGAAGGVAAGVAQRDLGAQLARHAGRARPQAQLEVLVEEERVRVERAEPPQRLRRARRPPRRWPSRPRAAGAATVRLRREPRGQQRARHLPGRPGQRVRVVLHRRRRRSAAAGTAARRARAPAPRGRSGRRRAARSRG